MWNRVERVQPIDSRNRSDIIADRILQMLGSADYRPGQRLPTEKQLCERFGVGRASVREALKKLEILGVIEIRQGEGTFLQEVSPLGFWEMPLPLSRLITLRKRDLVDLMHIRRTIELETARVAAARRTGDHLAQLWALMDQMGREHGDAEAFLQTDLQFHITVAEATGNRVFPRLLNQVRELYVLQYKHLICRIPGVTHDSFRYHTDIVRAIEEGDGERAQAVMGQHLANSEKIVLELLEHVGMNQEVPAASRGPVASPSGPAPLPTGAGPAAVRHQMAPGLSQAEPG